VMTTASVSSTAVVLSTMNIVGYDGVTERVASKGVAWINSPAEAHVSPGTIYDSSENHWLESGVDDRSWSQTLS